MSALDAPERRPEARGALMRIRGAAERLKRRIEPEKDAAPLSLGGLVALAFPDRVAVRRGDGPRYHLTGGKGAALAEGDPLTTQPYLAVAELGHGPGDRAGAEAKIRLAAPIDRAEIETLFEQHLEWRESCAWSKRERQAVARRRLHLFETVLEERPCPDPAPEAWGAAMADGVRQLGLDALPWTPAARRLQARIARAQRDPSAALPNFSDAALRDALDDWLTPHLAGMRRQSDLDKLDLLRLLEERLGWDARQRLDAIVPSHYRAPTGTRAPIDYGDPSEDPPPAPRIAIKLQELFGEDRHPRVAGEPLLIDLLSPAGRPLQTTGDLPGFWRGSYADVAKEMRARYPRHPWPDDPVAAAPTRRAKPRSQ